MVKKLLKIVSVLLILALCVAGIFFYSIFISVERLNVQYETISSTKIPADLNDVKIAYINDLEYNHYMDKERFTKMVDTINDARPDVLIFGGDIFYSPLTNIPDEAIKQELITLLKSIDAPLGKFAVYGEQDHADETTFEMVKDILYKSDFEVLNNTYIRIRNGSNESVTLIGLDSMVAGTIDISSAFANVNAEEFNILAMHCPDTILLPDLPKSSIDLAFAGHTHASQVYLPFLGPLSTTQGAEHYNHGTYNINGLLLHVANGLGTTKIDMRLFSPPQMLVYRLQHEEVKLPDPEPSPEPALEESTNEPQTPEDTTDTPSEDTQTPPADEPAGDVQ